ncbi:hypothetical protein LMANV2_190004 [Leptospira interrogans serovar Manilae]|uniref:Uncharacterized protein n=1 Tax=Leptospira interrogans serovar Manilae TaxID=214675 RepID=A0AAQ1SMP0_LEPIR|nr:hypothetical protein LMANV2_190004 [Leptospira interrogans serovar Manilae]
MLTGKQWLAFNNRNLKYKGFNLEWTNIT